MLPKVKITNNLEIERYIKDKIVVESDHGIFEHQYSHNNNSDILQMRECNKIMAFDQQPQKNKDKRLYVATEPLFSTRIEH